MTACWADTGDTPLQKVEYTTISAAAVRRDARLTFAAVMTRLTAAGALYISSVGLLPEFLIIYWNVPFYFGGTSLLIVVSVTMDTVGQVHSHLLAHQYEGLIKKTKLKGRRAQ